MSLQLLNSAGIATADSQSSGALLHRFHQVRATTARLAQSLSPEDQMVQSCPEASPVKWHLAHTTWFFETFILSRYLPDYRPFHPDFPWLFNSYYNSLGNHPEKRLRGSFSRPSLGQVLDYREHVEDHIGRLLNQDASSDLSRFVELGMHHEQQHQELIATDIKHAFWSNPLQPAYTEKPLLQHQTSPVRHGWIKYHGGLIEIGHTGEGFAFDNELSRHSVFLDPFRLASHPVTCREYLTFVDDGGYQRPELWLSDGWDTLQEQRWQAPLYWKEESGQGWDVFTLRGPVPLKDLLDTPVCHVSYYEADAYARWAGHRLPTEFEWEHAAAMLPVSGNLLESDTFHPSEVQFGSQEPLPSSAAQMFGDVWEWTQSAYSAYPGFSPAAGALGEYNGKFMCNQLVLRGGSAVTPSAHIRASYRNFFVPATRWQFSGIRLASDGASE
ncbi:MAG TPA: ergothioneine biosynthesis protein EgtB [Acidobacteriaceae bacterium]|nr:ergothioneine biosynthesis protein EgtB [Acidobacteriaceae bacterium]